MQGDNKMLKEDLNKNPFKIPDNYFDTLPSRVQERCAEQSKKPATIWSILRPQWSLVAGVGVFALLAYGGFFFVNKNDVDAGFAQGNSIGNKWVAPSANMFNKQYIQLAGNNSQQGHANGVKTVEQAEMSDLAESYLAADNSINIDYVLDSE